MSELQTLQRICEEYGFRLEYCADPAESADAIGERGATSCAQLLSGNRVMAKPSVDSLHSIAHEIGHGVALRNGFELCNERLATLEQVAFLTYLSKRLLAKAPSA